MGKRNARLGRSRRTIVLNVDVARRRRRGAAPHGEERRRGRPWTRLSFAAGAVLISFALFAAGAPQRMLRPAGFTLRWVEVSNEHLLPKEEIAALAGVKVGDNLLAIDIRKVRERLLAHPDIREAVVRRLIPGRLAVEVYERTPIASFYAPSCGLGTQAQRHVIDAEGVVLSARKERSNRNLPVVIGLELGMVRPGDRLCSAAAKRAIEVVGHYRTSGLPRQMELTGVDVSDPENCVMRSRSIQEIKLGGEDIPERLRLLSYILGQRVARGMDVPARYIDLRWRDVAEMPLAGATHAGSG